MGKKRSQKEKLTVEENNKEDLMVKRSKNENHYKKLLIEEIHVEELMVAKNEEGEELMIERCNLHRRQVLPVYAMAYSEDFKRLCVIRKMKKDGVIGINNLTMVEFYNASNPPLVFFEKSIPLFDSLESCIWMENWIVTGGLSGKLYFFTPFTSRFKRTQISTTEITSIAQLDSEQFVLTNNSAELMIFSKQEQEDESNPLFTNRKRIKFPTDRHLIASTCIERIQHESAFIAVGMVNWISIVKLKNCKSLEEEDRIDIPIPHTKANSNLICSLIFLDNFLFTGDSGGDVTIYDAENGQIIKTFKSHLNNVLALATDGLQIFASGDDCRIQIIARTEKGNFGWQQTGQRAFHTNAVRSLCSLNADWLISGGFEGINISGKHTICKPQLRPECAFSNANGLLVIRKLMNVDLWRKPLNGGLANHEKFKQFSPKLLIRIESGTMGIIKQTSLSPNGNFFCFSGNLNGALSILRIKDDLGKKFKGKIKAKGKDSKRDDNSPIELYWTNNDNKNVEQKVDGGKTVTALYCTDRHLYYAIGEFTLFQIDLSNKKLQTISKKINRGYLLKISTNQAETLILALTNSGAALLYKGHFFENLEALDFQYDVPYDTIFLDNCRIAFLMSNLERHLVIFDTSLNQQLLVKSSKQLSFFETEWIAYAAFSQNKQQLFATTNKGRIITLNYIVEQNELEMFIIDSECDLRTIAKSKDIRIETFIGNENKNLQRSLIAVGHVEEIIKQ